MALVYGKFKNLDEKTKINSENANFKVLNYRLNNFSN